VANIYILRGEKGGRGSNLPIIRFFLQQLFDKSESFTNLNNCGAIDRTEDKKGGADERQ